MLIIVFNYQSLPLRLSAAGGETNQAPGVFKQAKEKLSVSKMILLFIFIISFCPYFRSFCVNSVNNCVFHLKFVFHLEFVCHIHYSFKRVVKTTFPE